MATKLSILRSDIIFDKNINFTDLRVYAAICMYTNSSTDKAFPHQETIAKKLQTSISAVSRSVANLKKYKYISVEPKIDNNGRKIQNIYTIYYDINGEQNELIKNDNSVSSGLITTDNHGLITTDNSYNINSLNYVTPLTIKTNKKNNHIPQVDKTVFTEQEKYFLNFYESYPKKINKPNAEKTFNKLLSVNKKDIPAFIENLTIGLEKYKELLFYRKTELQYIPNPQAWLNAAGWESIETYQAEIEQLKAQNSTNSYKNGNSYQQTETYTPKQPLNDDKNSKDYFSYRFNEDISVAFGYQECIELTNSIIEQKPEFEKVARTKALLEWLRTETKSQYNTKIKSEVLDIYKKGGYDVFVSKAIQENPNSPWKSLLELLNN